MKLGRKGHEKMDIKRSGAEASQAGTADYFTGRVRLDARFSATAPARVSGATVTFEPGARTNWHTHPLGQTLFVLSGLGWAQREGGPVETLRPGDIVWFPPDEKHWHGATDATAMSHLAVAEVLDGSPVTWLEPVTDADYSGPAS
jgi:quercetin dioxygenase-like cupin family protein